MGAWGGGLWVQRGHPHHPGVLPLQSQCPIAPLHSHPGWAGDTPPGTPHQGHPTGTPRSVPALRGGAPPRWCRGAAVGACQPGAAGDSRPVTQPHHKHRVARQRCLAPRHPTHGPTVSWPHGPAPGNGIPGTPGSRPRSVARSQWGWRCWGGSGGGMGGVWGEPGGSGGARRAPARGRKKPAGSAGAGGKGNPVPPAPPALPAPRLPVTPAPQFPGTPLPWVRGSQSPQCPKPGAPWVWGTHRCRRALPAGGARIQGCRGTPGDRCPIGAYMGAQGCGDRCPPHPSSHPRPQSPPFPAAGLPRRLPGAARSRRRGFLGVNQE